MTEQLVYRAREWGSIAGDLPATDSFTNHIKAKSRAASDRFGGAYPFAETVEADAANGIREIANRQGIKGQVEEQR